MLDNCKKLEPVKMGRSERLILEAMLDGAKLRMRMFEHEKQTEFARRKNLHPYDVPLDAGYWYQRGVEISNRIKHFEELLASASL